MTIKQIAREMFMSQMSKLSGIETELRENIADYERWSGEFRRAKGEKLILAEFALELLHPQLEVILEKKEALQAKQMEYFHDLSLGGISDIEVDETLRQKIMREIA